MKKKPNKRNTIMITITFLIALFFLGRWVWSVIPHYKTEEFIAENYHCADLIGGDECFHLVYDEYGFLSLFPMWFEVKDYFCEEDDTCYIKRKVKIN